MTTKFGTQYAQKKCKGKVETNGKGRISDGVDPERMALHGLARVQFLVLA
jgi:hypothetical protein